MDSMKNAEWKALEINRTEKKFDELIDCAMPRCGHDCIGGRPF